MNGPCPTCPFRRGPLHRWARRTIAIIAPGRLRRFLSRIRGGELPTCHDSSGNDVYNRKLWYTRPVSEHTSCIGAFRLGQRMKVQDRNRALREDCRGTDKKSAHNL